MGELQSLSCRAGVPGVHFLRLPLLGVCVRADPATDFAAFEDLGFLRILAAFEATLLDVCSLRAMILASNLECFYPIYLSL